MITQRQRGEAGFVWHKFAPYWDLMQGFARRFASDADCGHRSENYFRASTGRVGGAAPRFRVGAGEAALDEFEAWRRALQASSSSSSSAAWPPNSSKGKKGIVESDSARDAQQQQDQHAGANPRLAQVRGPAFYHEDL